MVRMSRRCQCRRASTVRIFSAVHKQKHTKYALLCVYVYIYIYICVCVCVCMCVCHYKSTQNVCAQAKTHKINVHKQKTHKTNDIVCVSLSFARAHKTDTIIVWRVCLSLTHFSTVH